MAIKVYSVTNDFTNSIIDPDSLDRTLQESSISSYDGIRLDGDILQILFTEVLNQEDEDELSSIISNHDGSSYSGTWGNTKSIFLLNRDPVPADDELAGHVTGELWLNTNTNEIYIITDDTANNAKWSQITNEVQLTYILDGYATKNYHDHDIEDILAALDGYHPDITGTEHYHQHSEAIETILQALDGYSGAGNVFGNNYQYVENLSASETTSTSWQTKVTLTTSSISGTHIVQWMAIATQKNFPGEYRLWNDTDSIEYMEHSIDDNAPPTNNNRHVGGFTEVEFSGAPKVFKVQWRSTKSKHRSYIKDAKLMIWRAL